MDDTCWRTTFANTGGAEQTASWSAPATGRNGGGHADKTERRPAGDDRRGSGAQLSALADGRRASAPWHVAGCAEPSAVARGTIPGLHNTNPDHLVRGVCRGAGRQAQWHLFRRGRERSLPRLLRHAPAAWRTGREIGASGELRSQTARKRAPAHSASAATRMARVCVGRLDGE